MYFHVMVGSNDLVASKAFYDAALGALGIPSGGEFREDPQAFMYGTPESGLFFVSGTIDRNPATYANGGTIMFKADSPEAVDAWYAAGMAAGGADVSGAPGPGGVPGTIMGYLRDPTGNKIAAVAFL